MLNPCEITKSWRLIKFPSIRRRSEVGRVVCMHDVVFPSTRNENIAKFQYILVGKQRCAILAGGEILPIQTEFRWRRMQFFGSSEISPSPPAPTASGNNAHMMYVFNRNGVCLLYREWNRPLRTLDAQQDQKLMFGLLFSLKSLTAKMDPTT